MQYRAGQCTLEGTGTGALCRFLSFYHGSCHAGQISGRLRGLLSAQHDAGHERGSPLVGGSYWGRYIYKDIYAQLTPAEMIGTIASCGIDGYTCFGIVAELCVKMLYRYGKTIIP